MYKKALVTLGVGLALLLSSQSALAAQFNVNLSIGSKSSEVFLVQTFLIDQGYLSGTATGYFGALTKKAVQAFQKKNNLPTTGGWFTLTRQKANTFSTSSSSLTLPKDTVQPKNVLNPSSSIKKDATLTMVTTSGGLIYYSDNMIACYTFETCKKTFPSGTKITLKAVTTAGYIFAGWSEASCGASLECTVLLIEDTTVYAKFNVQTTKRTGKILHPTPTDVCYVSLGDDKCNLPVYWINDTGLDMTIRVDGSEYYIGTEDPASPMAKYPLNPDLAVNSDLQNAMGPVYFELSPETWEIELKSGKQILDTVKIEVKCALGSYFKYRQTCWIDGAKRLFTFKQEGVLIKSDPPGITCGYKLGKCAAAFPLGTKVTLTATPLPGYSVSSWTAECVGQSSPCTFIMDKDKSIWVK